MSRAGHTIAQSIASIGLDGGPTEPISISDEDAASSLSALRSQRILGVAVAGLEAGAVVANPDVDDMIVAAHDDVMAQTMRIEIAAVAVCSMLADADIDYRFLKGAALAHTVAVDPSQRTFRDVDVLVPSAQVDDAVQLLISAGATRLQPELRPGYDARFGKSVTMRLGEVEIDLHRLLAPGPFGVWMKPDDLFLLRRSFPLADSALATLDATDHLVHACYHVALGQAESALVNLRDIGLLAGRRDEPAFDVERFNDMVKRWRGAAVIRRAVGLVRSQLEVELPDALMVFVHEQVDAEQLDAIEPYLTDDPQGRFAALAPATLRALPMADRPAYARAIGLPEGSNPVDRVKSILKRRR